MAAQTTFSTRAYADARPGNFWFGQPRRALANTHRMERGRGDGEAGQPCLAPNTDPSFPLLLWHMGAGVVTHHGVRWRASRDFECRPVRPGQSAAGTDGDVAQSLDWRCRCVFGLVVYRRDHGGHRTQPSVDFNRLARATSVNRACRRECRAHPSATSTGIFTISHVINAVAYCPWVPH